MLQRSSSPGTCIVDEAAGTSGGVFGAHWSLTEQQQWEGGGVIEDGPASALP